MYHCPCCEKDMTSYNYERREQHVNFCLDGYANKRNSHTSFGKQTSASNHMKRHCSLGNGSQMKLQTVPGPIEVITESSKSISDCDKRVTASESMALLDMKTSAVEDSFRTSAVATEKRNAFQVLMQKSKLQATPRLVHGSTKLKHVSSVGLPGSEKAGVLKGCPDFKIIKDTNPPFVVDGFRFASKKLTSVYFLSHFHSDHYVGINKNFNAGTIYCSTITAKLLKQQLKVSEKHIYAVNIGTAIVVHDTEVTFLDANHCPGACIMLFRLANGTSYLHTGDFRYHDRMLQYRALQRFMSRGDNVLDRSRILNGIYLDTTYANPKYTFDRQEVVIEHIAALVMQHYKRNMIVFGAYTIGKERVFMKMAKRFQLKVCVSKQKLNIISKYGWPDSEMKFLTTDPSATSFFVLSMYELKFERLRKILDSHTERFQGIIAFRPTGWTYNRKKGSTSSMLEDASGRIKIFGVPYSEHSNFTEICQFVCALKPLKIIPTVNCSTELKASRQVDLIQRVAFNSIF